MDSVTTTTITQSLDDLLKARYHGATNIAGIRYQLFYSLVRLFDLYDDTAIQEIQFEGHEDLDRKGVRAGNTYCQVKSSRNEQTWSWLTKEKIFDHFIAVFRADPDARFVVVTNFAFKGQLNELARFCNQQTAKLSPDLQRDLEKIARGAGLEQRTIAQFLSQVCFERASEPELLQRLRGAIVRHLGIETGNTDLYLTHLVSCAITWAADRAVITKQQVETEKSRVLDWINSGTRNPAVVNRLVRPLLFSREEMTADYYEGKNARPGHIAAGLDAPRPVWQASIVERLQRVHVCVIRASSGQGKSTLLYRYAFEHFIPDAVYRMRSCSTDEQVGQIITYLIDRQALGLRLIVLIDALDQRTHLWYRVAAELAGAPIHFLVATREEDWYRYSQGMSGFAWDLIEPQLSLEEARDIFRYFQRNGRLAANVSSAAWAYAQVVDQKLLIEFVYLITHGQMLAERIHDQVHFMRQEDQAKIDILRLVATAHIYKARVRIDTLLQNVSFHHDQEATLRSLEGEYITLLDDECEGLHVVRSQHLVHELHGIVPIEQTLIRLIRLLDQANLIALVSHVFADRERRLDDLANILVERCQNLPLSFTNQVIEALFWSSEVSYFQAYKHLFDAAIDQIGLSAIPMLTSATIPTGDLDVISRLTAMMPDNKSLRYLQELVPQFRSRTEVGGQQGLQVFLQGMVSNLPLDRTMSLSDIASFSTWCQFLNTPVPTLDTFFATNQWETSLFQSDCETISGFLDALYRWLPIRYHTFVGAQKERFFKLFKQCFRTLMIEEHDETISVEFLVDIGDDALKPNDQAVRRLEHLRRWFPNYIQYCSQGFHPVTGEKAEDTYKTISGETLDLGLRSATNVLYARIVSDNYAPSSSNEWARRWYNVRKTMLDFAHAVIAKYERIYRGTQSHDRRVLAYAIAVDLFSPQAPELPLLLRDRFVKQQNTINRWESSFHNFVKQFLEHDRDDPNNHASSLMRYNLKDALAHLSAMHQAFDEIFQAETDHEGAKLLDAQEAETYEYLADILDYWFTSPSRQTYHLRRTVRRWKEEQQRIFSSRVQEALDPLVQAGMTLLYPTGVLHLDTYPLTGLCIGYEILDFEQHIKHIELICAAIAQLEADYTFLYLIPTVNKHLYGLIIRISRDLLQKLLAGETVDQGIYPVQAPVGLKSVLPDLDLTPLHDVALVHQLGILLIPLVAARNTLYFARSKLDRNIVEEKNLLDHYEQSSAEQIDEVQGLFSQLLAEALAYEQPDSALRAWLTLWADGGQYIQSLVDCTDIPATYIPQKAEQHPLLDQLFYQYMNRKYIGIDALS